MCAGVLDARGGGFYTAFGVKTKLHVVRGAIYAGSCDLARVDDQVRS